MKKRGLKRVRRSKLSETIAYDLQPQGDRYVLTVSGEWTVDTIADLDSDLRRLPQKELPYLLDVTELGRLDTAGAFLIDRTLRQSCKFGDPPLELIGNHSTIQPLLNLVRANSAACEIEPQQNISFVDMLERVGRGAHDFAEEVVGTFSFIGHTAVVAFKYLFKPHKVRWRSVVSIMESAGLDALPIVAFLSFFVGMVIAFIGATILRQTVGATVFTVELVGWAMLREFGVVLTGILLAGRTNSSFTAQIGAMKMRQEIDAMRTLGLDPYEVLVIPRVIAMVLMTPFLAFAATLSGIFGGLLVGWLALDISPVLFINRLQDTVPVQNFWVGISKAPVFAGIIAIVACRQGLKVGGDVQSLGQATTASVVHAIFFIIVADAIFAMMYMELGI